MTDQPFGNANPLLPQDDSGSSVPPQSGQESGWVTPKNAILPGSLPNAPSAHVPVPTDAYPQQPGGWFVPPEATVRVSAIIQSERERRMGEINQQMDAVGGVVGSPSNVAGTPNPTPPPSTQGSSSSRLSAMTDLERQLAAGKPSEPAVSEPATEPQAEVKAEVVAEVKPEVKAEAEQPALAYQGAGGQGGMSLQGVVDLTPATPVADSPDVKADALPVASEMSATITSAQEATPAEPAAPVAEKPSLAQRFDEVEGSVQRLRRRYTAGGLTRDQLKEELRKLMILDDDGAWWMIGLETDNWYKFNGKDWVADTPPGQMPKAAAAPAGPKPPLTFAKQDLEASPVPKKVSMVDEGGTVVGKWASRLDAEENAPAVGTPAGVQPYDGGLTVPSKPVQSGDLTVASAPVSAGGSPRLAPPSPSIPAPAGNSALSTARNIPQQGGATPTSPAAGPLQPNYGPPPSGLLEDRQRLGGCLITAALGGMFMVLALTICGVAGSVLWYTSVINKYTTQIASLGANVDAASQSVRFYDSKGNQLYQLNDPNLGARINVPLDQISPYMVHATVSTENERFYSDPGFDILGIIRAVLQNVTGSSGTSSGASTITQQLTRARVLDPSTAYATTFTRKIEEIFVSSEIARKYSKSQIVEYYLNTFYFGNLAYGVEAAANVYFRKGAKDLNLAEASILAGLLQAPAVYDPATNPQGAIDRAKTVRRLMLEAGCIRMEHAPYNQAPFCVRQTDIDSAVVQIAQTEAGVATYQPPRATVKYPHAILYARTQLENLFGQDALYSSAFNVYLTLDPQLQDAAEAAVRDGVARLASQRASNGAALTVRPSDGAILAMVGSADYYNDAIDGQVNVVLAPRQPGSAIKPFVYLAAFEGRADSGLYWTPATVIWDVPSVFAPNNYTPTNYDNRFHGPHSLRSSLANSYNVPAVKALDFAGVDHFIDVSNRVGLSYPLTTPQQAGLAAALGATEVRMIDLVHAYAVLASGGVSTDFYIIDKITRRVGGSEEAVLDFKTTLRQPEQVVQPGYAYLLTSILADNAARVPAFGNGSALVLRNGHLAAVKTGTTNSYRDSWTVGYTPDVVTGVWVGNSDGTPMGNVAGSLGAAPIWNQIMVAALANYQPKQFPMPNTIQQLTICADFGTQDSPTCTSRIAELFASSNPPPPASNVVASAQIDTFTGLLANANCPEYVKNVTYLNITDQTAITWLNNDPNGQAWATARGLTLPLSTPPNGECPPGQARPIVKLTSPQGGAQVSGLLEIFGQVQFPALNRYQLEIGIGQQPSAYAVVDGPFGVERPQNSFLGRLDTSRVPDGIYSLKLWAVDSQGRFVEVIVPVYINNTTPIIATAPPPAFPTQPPFNQPTPTSPFFVQPTETPGFFFPTVEPTPIIIISDPIAPTEPISIFPPTPGP
jgi:membrane peptidoglycan carboxypeptidase